MARAHPFPEIAVFPEGENIPVEFFPGFLGDGIRVEKPAVDGAQLPPDEGTLGVRINDDADGVPGRGGAGDEVVLPDDGSFVFHEKLEGSGLAEGRVPGVAVFVRFKSVFPKPSGEEIGPLRADLGFCGKIGVMEGLQPGEIIKAQFR
jgi:hypothetical protein